MTKWYIFMWYPPKKIEIINKDRLLKNVEFVESVIEVEVDLEVEEDFRSDSPIFAFFH